MSPSVSLNGNGIDEQLYTSPGAVDARQMAMAHQPWPLVYVAKPDELPSQVPPQYLGSQVFSPGWAQWRLQ